MKKTMTYTLSILGSILLIVMILYFGVSLYQKLAISQPVSGDNVLSSQGYSQAELDAAVEAAVVENEQQIAAAASQEVLDTLKGHLLAGDSAVQSLRKMYKDDLVLASGGRYHFIPIQDSLAKNNYVDTNLNILEDGEIQYFEDEVLVSHKGIDVSKHNGTIDWKKVAADGVEFAFIRVGNRGYGSEGTLMEDPMFETNASGANKAGIRVGVYFYTQALNEQELLEEVDMVLKKIAPYKIECPVVFDVEKVSGADGRMNSISVEERTRLTKLFCEKISEAGYTPMIYQNMEMGAMMLDLTQLEAYEKWFAYYNPDFYYPYAYSVWQYSQSGTVDGVKGNVDLNIAFKPLWK